MTLWAAGLVLGVGGLDAQTVPPSESLLPNTTVGFISISDANRLEEHWNQTQVGQLGNDPKTQGFIDDLKQEFVTSWVPAFGRLGLTLNGLKGVPGGEVGMAEIRPALGKAAVAVVVDITDHLKEATEMLQEVSQNLIKQGAKRTMVTVPESPNPLVYFDVPPPPENPKGPRQKVYYFVVGNLLGAADDLEVIRGILSRMSGKGKDTLAEVPAFSIVMARCQKDIAAGVVPQIRWFMHPVGYTQAIRSATPEENRREGKSIFELLESQGFEAVQGMGGYFDFAAEGFEVIYRTATYAPPPYEKSMKMLVFPNRSEHAPQSWVPRDVATYISLYCDLLNGFDNFGPLFDEVSGRPVLLFRADAKCQEDLDKGVLPPEFPEKFQQRRIRLSQQMSVETKETGSVWEIAGSVTIRGKVRPETFIVRKKEQVIRVYQVPTGIWKEVLENFRTDLAGPQVALRSELIQHLGQRVTLLSDYVLPITPSSERLLVAIETTDADKVQAALKKVLSKEPNARRVEYLGHDIWEMVEPEPDEFDEEEEDGEGGGTIMSWMPHAAITVAHGQLLVGSHLDFLKKVLQPKRPGDTLGTSRDIDYLRVDDAIKRLGVTDQCGRVFSRADQEYRVNYELLRQGKMAEAESILGRLLSNSLSPGPGEVRSQRIPFKNMPAFDTVRHSLGPAGSVLSSEKDGWFLKGFMLKKGP